MFSFPTFHCLTMSLFYRTRCMLGIPMGATTGVSCHQVKYETRFELRDLLSGYLVLVLPGRRNAGAVSGQVVTI